MKKSLIFALCVAWIQGCAVVDPLVVRVEEHNRTGKNIPVSGDDIFRSIFFNALNLMKYDE